MSDGPEGPPPGSRAAWTELPEGLTPGGEPVGVRYAPGGELGRGGMGVVRAAVDGWLERDVAVKRPRAELSAAGRARMMREARITARLVHPSIVPVYDVGEDDLGPFYTMPVLVGRTLRERLGGPLRPLVEALATACRAAGYAHRRGVVHRDLKPENLLLGADGEVWVLDWGVASDPAAPDAAVVGTPGFQAPEQAAGAPASPAADVYSLGQTLRAVLEAQAEPVPELWAVVARCTETAASARYPDASALAEELARWLDGQRVRAHAYSAGEVLWRAALRWRAPLTVAGVAAVLGAVLGGVALAREHAERVRADRALSASLAWQAAALAAREARPEAEVLAAHSLALAENPVARGVLMRWDGTPRLALRGAVPPPCERAFTQVDASVVCAGERLRVLDPDGVERWSADLPTPPPGAGWLGEVVDARLFPGGVLLQRSTNRVEVWAPGRRATMTEAFLGTLGLADGDAPAIFLDGRLGRVDLDSGEVAWEPAVCERIESALLVDGAVLVGCREPVAVVARGAGPTSRIELPGSPSALAWVDGPVIGTFEGQLVLGERGEVVASGVGAPRQLLALPGGRVAVSGEGGSAGLWSVEAGAFLGMLPRGGGRLAARPGELIVAGAEVRRYALPDALAPVRFDRSAQGGLSFLDLSPSGRLLLGGSATGEIVTWETATGAARRVEPGGEAAAKGGVFLSDERIAFARLGSGMVEVDLRTGERRAMSASFGRVARRTDAGVALLPWSAEVVLVDPTERVVSLGARPLALLAGPELLVADAQGRVSALEGARVLPRFTLPSPTAHLVRSGDLLLSSRDEAVEARTEQGALRWTWTGTAAVTALAADAHHVVVGDLDGRIVVLRPDGVVVASVRGHARRVSELILRDAALFSASWDGTARRWGLGELAGDGLVARLEAAWGLGLEAALAGADAP